METKKNIRKTDELGRVVLPAEIRRGFGIKIKDDMEIFAEAGAIILKKYEAACIFCGSSGRDLKFFKEKNVCSKCAEDLRNGI